MTSSKLFDPEGRLLPDMEPPPAGEPFELRVDAHAATLITRLFEASGRTLVRPQRLESLDAAFAVLLDCDEKATVYQRMGEELAQYIAVRYGIHPDEVDRAAEEIVRSRLPPRYFAADDDFADPAPAPTSDNQGLDPSPGVAT